MHSYPSFWYDHALEVKDMLGADEITEETHICCEKL